MGNDRYLYDTLLYLEDASDLADGPVQTHIDSVHEGLSEELEDGQTQDGPGSEADRVAELLQKIEGLVAETNGVTARALEDARECCIQYQKS